MTYKSLAVFALALYSITSYSQTKYFGVKAGANITSINFSDAAEPKEDIGYRISYHAGMIGYLKINKNWTLQPEILYSDQGYKTRTNPDIRYSCKYITLPLLFKYQPNDFFFYLGPQYSILLDARRHNKTTNKKENITASIDSQELSLTTGLGTMVSEKIGIEGRCFLGVTTFPDGYDVLNIGFQASVFYTFNKPQTSTP